MNLALNSGRARERGRQWQTLVRRADFLRIAASGLRHVTPAFTLQAAARDGDDTTVRIGFTATRKLGNAVIRNRAKRRLRALADRVIPTDANPALDYVLIGRSGALTRTFDAMEIDLRGALKRISRGKARTEPATA